MMRPSALASGDLGLQRLHLPAQGAVAVAYDQEQHRIQDGEQADHRRGHELHGRVDELADLGAACLFQNAAPILGDGEEQQQQRAAGDEHRAGADEREVPQQRKHGRMIGPGPRPVERSAAATKYCSFRYLGWRPAS
jgi:hypothetical protein